MAKLAKQVVIKGKGAIVKTQTYEQKMALVLAKQAEQSKLKAEQKAAKKLKSSKPGIIATIGNTIMQSKTPLSKAQILAVLVTEFGSTLNEQNKPKHTAESMGKTITAQLGTKRPMRFERENKVCFEITLSTEGNRLFSYIA